MSEEKEIQALSRVLDALYQSVTESKGWDEFKLVLSGWLGASACEFLLPDQFGFLALPNGTEGPAAAREDQPRRSYTALAPIGERKIGLSIYRSSDEPEFDILERGRLDIVASHLAQAIQLRRMVDAKEEIVRSARTALQHVPTSVALLGRRGEALLSSAKFAEMTARSAYLSVLDGYVVLRDPGQQARFLDHLGALSSKSSTPLTFLFETNGTERLYGTVRSLLRSLSQTEWPTANENAIAVLILESVPTIEAPEAERISEALGISPAQGRLVAALVAGKSIKEYAFEAGISIHTARTHLKKVFLTLDVQSQAGLVRLVLTRVRGISVGA